MNARADLSGLPTIDAETPHLADVTPSVLAAMGVPGFEPRIALNANISGGCVLLIDGLGAELLDAHPHDAPVLSSLPNLPLRVGFPATTAAGLAAIGTGCQSGEHGMVGYTFHLPQSGLVNALRWRPHPWGDDLRATAIPEEIQPISTTFERAASTSTQVRVISGAEFTGSGLTRAVLRGGEYVGVHALGDLAAAVQTAVRDRAFCYAYHSQLDLVGHLHGPASTAWRMQLRQVDRLVESIIDALPPGGLLAVVADHGMVRADYAIDLDSSDALNDGVRAIGGEPRARHIYAEDGATNHILARYQELIGPHGWVVTQDEAIAAGWFGPRVSARILPRIGDVVVAAKGTSVLVRRKVEPAESALVGHHGSLTSAEQRVPLLLAYG